MDKSFWTSGRFWISGVVMSVAALLLGFVVHELLLGDDYMAVAALYRTEADAANYFPYMIAAHVLIGFALTWIYRQGARSDRGVIGQGLRFGLAIALVSSIPWCLIYYAVQPLPADLVHKQMLFEGIGMLLLGVLVAWLNPPPTTV